MAKRAKPGDVVRVGAEHGAVYLHYLGKHPEYGDTVAVCPTWHACECAVSAELFREGYVAFFPVAAAVWRDLAVVVGHLPSPGIPKRLRRPGLRSTNGVETWVVEDGTHEVVVKALSDAERTLPIAAIWNRELLLQRVSEGWRPETEGGAK